MTVPNLPENISFEEWVKHVFDHPESPCGPWWENDDEPCWAGDSKSELVINYVTRLFESPGFLIEDYSANQIDVGIDYIINNCASNHWLAFCDEAAPIDTRLRAIRSIAILFRDLMAPVYQDRTGHDQTIVNEGHGTYSCYMFWDVLPTFSLPESPHKAAIDDEVLAALEQILAIDSIACVESALHGLCEVRLSLRNPDRAVRMIDRFLETNADLAPSLRKYAMGCRTGYFG